MSRSVRAATWRRPAPLVALVLAAALVVLVVLALTSVSRSRAAAPSSALRVAKAEAIAFFTLDYRHIDAQLATVQKLATGSFKSSYAAKAAQIKTGVVDAELSSTATVASDAAGLEYETARTAIVLVGVDSTTSTPATSKAAASSRTSRYRMRVTVEQVHGSWLVSSIEQVG